MPHIVIISSDSLFSDAVSDLLTHELNASITSLKQEDTLADISTNSIDMIVAHTPLTQSYGIPVRLFSQGNPEKMAPFIRELSEMFQLQTPKKLRLSKNIHFDTSQRRLESLDGSKRLELTEKEEWLLLFMFDKRTATHESILQHVWGFSAEITTHTLETHLYRLRQKWRELEDFDCILATQGGYRWYE